MNLKRNLAYIFLLGISNNMLSAPDNFEKILSMILPMFEARLKNSPEHVGYKSYLESNLKIINERWPSVVRILLASVRHRVEVFFGFMWQIFNLPYFTKTSFSCHS